MYDSYLSPLLQGATTTRCTPAVDDGAVDFELHTCAEEEERQDFPMLHGRLAADVKAAALLALAAFRARNSFAQPELLPCSIAAGASASTGAACATPDAPLPPVPPVAAAADTTTAASASDGERRVTVTRMTQWVLSWTPEPACVC